MTKFFNKEITPPIDHVAAHLWKVKDLVLYYTDARCKIFYIDYDEKPMVWFEGYFGKTEKFAITEKDITFSFIYNIEKPSKLINSIKINNSVYDLDNIYLIEGHLEYSVNSYVYNIRDKLSDINSFKITMTSIAFLFNMWYFNDDVRRLYLLKTDKMFIINMLLERMRFSRYNDKDIIHIIENMKKMELETIIENYF